MWRKASLALIALLTLAAPAGAAITYVGTATQVTSAAASVPITISATTQYDLVVVGVKLPVAETMTGATDSAGNTYALIGPIVNQEGSTHQYVAYGVQVTGGTTTVTCAFNAAVTTKRIGADTFRGTAHTNLLAFDKSSSLNGVAATAYSVTSFAPEAAGQLVSSWGVTSVSVTWTAGTNYTLSSGSGSITMRSQYRLSSAASETAPMTGSANANWSELAVTFREHVVASTNTTAGFMAQ